MTSLTGAAFGGLIGLGVVLVVAGWRRVEVPWTAGAGRRVPAIDRLDRPGLRAGLAAAGMLVGAVVCRWPVAVVWLGVLGAALPSLVGAKAQRSASIARAEAVAGWAEMVRDTMAGGSQIEQALSSTAAVAPPMISDQVNALVSRMFRQDLDAALVAFSEEVADPASDVVVASLLLASRSRAGDLASVLGHAAEAARASAAMRLRIEASRARTYTAARLILGITAVYTVGLLVFDRPYLEPFGTPAGQVALVFIGSVVAVGLTGIARLGREPAQERLLVASAEGAP